MQEQSRSHALREMVARCGLILDQVCFMGDDVNDVEAMALAGLAAAPSSAVPAALQRAQFISTKSGGNGAVRELVDAILLAAPQRLGGQSA